MYKRLESLTQNASYNIVADHHPILGFSAMQDRQGRTILQPGNQGMQSVFRKINPLYLPEKVDMLLSGHVHAWQQVSFSSSHPTQFIAGFSGTMEDTTPLPARLPKGEEPAPGAKVDRMSSWSGGFGFMTMERMGDKKWKVRVWDTRGKLRNSCEIEGRHSACKLAKIE
jgi:hypothetical protein